MQFTQSLLLGAAVSLSFLSLAFACHGKLIASGITNEEKQVILQEHNRLRQVVATGRYPGQPGAENMREIVWDDELAARAQQWADNCQFRHDPHRTINRFTMGQNLAIIWSTAPLEADDGDFPSRIQSWFNEVQKYSFGDAWSPKTGHYSQLVWGETSLVGCGFAEYKDASKYNKLYVCNYGPGGNVVGYNPYEVGKPSCSTYGMRPSSRYNGLCAAPSAGAAANSLSSNTIETYEYNSNNNLPSNNYQNNKPTNTFNTQTQNAFAQTATNKRSHTYSPSYPQQASSVSLSSGTSTGSNSNSKGASATSNGGSSFGTSSRGGSTAYTTEASQYKYKNKYEAYKPSASEFEKSVHKHTILRTYIEQRATEQQQQQQQQDEDASTTPKTTKRGWSLLSWRG